MLGTLIPILIAGVAVALWLDALAARELACAHSRRLCEQANLQLLDQTVVLQRLRLARADGRIGLYRRYAFEVSFDGTDRHPGTISFLGRRRGAYTLPLRPQADALGWSAESAARPFT